MTGRREPLRDRRSFSVLAATSMVLLAWQIWILHAKYAAGEELVLSDGKFYYVYLPSILFDHDLDFANDYEAIDVTRSLGDPSFTREGYLNNLFTVGPALLWMPFFLLAHALTVLLNWAGAGLRADGYGAIEMSGVIIGNCAYGCAGLFLIFFTLRRRFSAFSSTLSVMSIAFCTSMLFYFGDRAFFPNAVELFAISLLANRFVFLEPEIAFASPAKLGLIVGIVGLVKVTDLLLFLLPAVLSAQYLFRAAAGRNWRVLRGLGLALLLAGVLNAPKLYVKQTLHPMGDPRLLSGYVHPLQPFFVEQLLSTRRGLLVWAPLLWLALPGTWLLWKLERRVALGVLVAVISMLYLNGVAADWWGGRSPGTRRLTCLLPLLALPLAASINHLTRKGRILPFALCAFFAADNCLLYRVFVDDPGFFRRTISSRELIGRKAEILLGAVGYPPGFPSTLIVSWRYGISRARAELVWGAYLDTDFEKLEFSNDSEFYLGRGWSGRQGNEDGVTYRETDGRAATILVGRLADSARMRAIDQVLVRARTEGTGASPLAMTINGTVLRAEGSAVLSREWQVCSFSIDSAIWRAGLNEVGLSIVDRGRKPSIHVDEMLFRKAPESGS
ncbi:MAG: hypothetical protein HYX75_04605 [Acidobacteria bacterium]|nr:hypothetical protein [Acidobacteriota bacterium]